MRGGLAGRAHTGVDLRTIQELMGHKTLAITLRYAHLSPTHLHAAVRALDKPDWGTNRHQTGTGTSEARGDESPSPRNYESG